MFFDENDNRNPRGRNDAGLRRQALGEHGGNSCDIQSLRMPRPGVTRSGRNVAPAGMSMAGCGCGTPHSDSCARSGDIKHDRSGHDTDRRGWGLCGYPLGSVYAPLQEWRAVYDIETGLSRGTIFRELDMPWYGSGGGMRGGCCRG